MNKPRWVSVLGGLSILISGGMLVSRAQDPATASQDPAVASGTDQLPVEHAECTFFGAQRDKHVRTGLKARGIHLADHALSDLTDSVVQMMGNVPPGSPTYGFQQNQDAGSIDSYIYADFQKNGITPAPATTDWEFIRRVTLDLTGRIPSPSNVLAFVASTDPQKRSKLIDQLLSAPEWVDKWTMFYGDLFKNTDNQPSTALRRFPQGRNAFYKWIHDSLANGKPYNQMATELISTADPNSYNNGATNWILNGWVSNGPLQDTIDSATAVTADTFRGMTHVNCVLCHNGRGHLDSISLWGSTTTRYQAWQLAGFMSHTTMQRTPVDPSNNNIYYWNVAENPKATDYAMNTTTGNRPARVAPAGCKSGQPCFYVTPQYIFNGDSPKPGENYRVAFAREITGDFQFARAAVNYLWAYFFGQGIVDPPDSFDPARLDPNNPPPAPWVLQPSNPKLLNALATHFIQSGYNVKSTMREIVNSQTYQLSSRYPGQWNPAWQPYFARKYVRRLWGEEIHDAIVVSSGTYPTYKLTGFTDQGFSTFSFAMQHPDVVGGLTSAITGDNQAGNANILLDTFLRGNRDDQPRRQDGSILQALNLMNNGFVESRTAYTGAIQSQLIVQHLTQSNTDLVNTLYLAILSRYPSTDESTKAVASLAGAGNRSQAVQDLVWALYNKVDFVFNY